MVSKCNGFKGGGFISLQTMLLVFFSVLLMKKQCILHLPKSRHLLLIREEQFDRISK